MALPKIFLVLAIIVWWMGYEYAYSIAFVKVALILSAPLLAAYAFKAFCFWLAGRIRRRSAAPVGPVAAEPRQIP